MRAMTRALPIVATLLTLAVTFSLHATPRAQSVVIPGTGSCETLTALTIANVTITSAQSVAAGQLPAPAGRAGANPYADPANFECRS